MTTINCPYCNHKPFRNETGLSWHLEHIHGEKKSSPTSSMDSLRSDEPRQADNKVYARDMTELMREIKEEVNSRLDIFTQRDEWLSGRITKLEQTIRKSGGR